MIAFLAMLLALPAVFGLAVAKISPENGVVSFQVRHKHYNDATLRSRSHLRRSSTVSSALSLNDKWIVSGGYFLDIDIGSSAQRLEVLLDTGSSDLFVPSAKANGCLDHRCPGGSFDEERSTSFKSAHEPVDFHIEYVDGSYANGTYVMDTIKIGQAIIEDHIFALADALEVSPYGQLGTGPQYGIAGLGYSGQEASVCRSAPANCDVNFTTPTILDALYDSGNIQSRSFSLYLDDLESGSGTILFGGIDHLKYEGDLVSLAVQKDSDPKSWTHGMYTTQSLLLTSVSSSINGNITQHTPSDYQSPVIIDSGAGFLGLPPPIYHQIIASTPIASEYNGFATIFCRHATIDAHITVQLAGVNGASKSIAIPYANLVVPLYEGTYDNPTPALHDGEALCAFTVSKGEVLGDPFLRSAYAVFDIDKKTVSLAQAKYGITESDVRAI